jgi:hypothetical protein
MFCLSTIRAETIMGIIFSVSTRKDDDGFPHNLQSLFSLQDVSQSMSLFLQSIIVDVAD